MTDIHKFLPDCFVLMVCHSTVVAPLAKKWDASSLLVLLCIHKILQYK